MEVSDIENRFTYHPPSSPAHENVRAHCTDLAHSINDLVPDGREKSLAITKLEEAMMWANAGIARNTGGE